MKTDIHPKYSVAQVTCGCGNVFTTRSTKASIQVEICSACHPFYTGKQKFVDTAGRVEKFTRKYAWTDGGAPARTAARARPGQGQGEKPAPAAAAPAAPSKQKPKTLEASSLKQFAARSKHAPAPVALPAKGSEKAAEAKSEAPAAAEAPKAEKPKAEKPPKAAKPKAEKKPEAPKPAEGEKAEAKAPEAEPEA